MNEKYDNQILLLSLAFFNMHISISKLGPSLIAIIALNKRNELLDTQSHVELSQK